MKKRIYLTLAALLSCSSMTYADSPSTQKWAPFFDAEGTIGSQRSRGEGDLFVPLAQNTDTLTFTDIRAQFDGSDNQEGNIGIGARRMLGNGINVGAYGYYDRRYSETGNIFNQATLGAEALSQDIDLRANVYQPFGDRSKLLNTSGGTSSAALNGANIQITTTATNETREVAMPGFDAEVGWRAPVFRPEELMQLRLYGGGYSFHEDGAPAVEGPRGRAVFTIYKVPHLWNGARLDLEGDWQHDDPRGAQSLASLRLRIPLQNFSGRSDAAESSYQPTMMERRMTDPIIRDVDIVSAQSVKTVAPAIVENATETQSGQALTVISSGSITGAALPGAVTAAGANNLVILSGAFNTTSTVTMQSGQSLMGAGTLDVKGASGHVASLTLPTATVSSAMNNPGVDADATIQMANNSSVEGLHINSADSGTSNAPNPAGIYASGVSNISITNNVVTATSSLGGGGAALGIHLAGNGTALVSGNSFTANGTALAIGADSVNVTGVTFANNTLSAAGDNGPDSEALFFHGNTFVTADSTGNQKTAGDCHDSGSNTGHITFTDTTTCP